MERVIAAVGIAGGAIAPLPEPDAPAAGVADDAGAVEFPPAAAAAEPRGRGGTFGFIFGGIVSLLICCVVVEISDCLSISDCLPKSPIVCLQIG